MMFVLDISVSESGICLVASGVDHTLKAGNDSSGTTYIVSSIDLQDSHQLSLRQTRRLTMLT